jgi:nucleoside-diphosphate kinase
MEKTLVLIKPDAIRKIEYILDIFYKNNLKIDQFKIMELDDAIIAEHYAHVLDKPFFPELKEFMTSAPVVAMVLLGENVVFRVREIVGKTNPTEAAPGTIRNLYGTDLTRNAVHASDSTENAKVEIERFFNRK